MPRSSYFQALGNPQQSDRLPGRPARFALLFSGDDERDVTTRCLRVVGLVIGFDLLDVFVRMQAGSTAVWFWQITVLLMSASWIGFSLHRREQSVRVIPLAFFVALALAIDVLAIPVSGFHLVAAGLAMSNYCRTFAQHWLQLCTASPLEATTARQLMSGWNGFLRVMTAVPTIAALAAVVLGNNEIIVGVFAVVVVVQLFMVVGRRGAWIGMRQSFRAWVGYNSHDTFRSGVVATSAGGTFRRQGLTFLCVALVSAAIRRRPPSELEADLAALCLVPTFITLVLPLTCWLVLAEAATYRRKKVAADEWSAVTDALRTSVNPIERRSYYMARVVSDGSPVVVPRRIFCEHAHFLGDSGSGKTSLGLAPWIEQTIAFGDCSVVVLDLKADSLELLATLEAGREELRRRTGRRLPLKFFSNQDHLETYGFNPLAQPFWNNFNPYVQTDILCSAAGLDYGSDYGAGFYSSSNSGVTHETIRSFPEIQSFHEMADRCGFVLRDNSNELQPEIRKSGVHVHEVLKRLGAFKALNVSRSGGYSAAAVEQAIDLTQVFREPCLHYFHLSATLTPGAAPAIGRLVTYMLLAASTQTERNVPVFLVIDEFQRMVAQNLDYLLQLARSMGVGVILANQSMEDLRTMKSNLIPAIESNCRYRQWFSVSGSDDRKRLTDSSGETIELFHSQSRSANSSGGSSASHSVSQRLMPRLGTNDILLTSDHPFRSILRISRGDGYAQYGGLPVIVEADYHISAEEYERRRTIEWPAGHNGTFIPREQYPNGLQPAPSSGPRISTEVISRPEPELTESGPFASFLSEHSTLKPPQARQRRSGNDN